VLENTDGFNNCRPFKADTAADCDVDYLSSDDVIHFYFCLLSNDVVLIIQ
jgi:hypothetical protein